MLSRNGHTHTTIISFYTTRRLARFSKRIPRDFITNIRFPVCSFHFGCRRCYMIHAPSPPPDNKKRVIKSAAFIDNTSRRIKHERHRTQFAFSQYRVPGPQKFTITTNRCIQRECIFFTSRCARTFVCRGLKSVKGICNFVLVQRNDIYFYIESKLINNLSMFFF